MKDRMIYILFTDTGTYLSKMISFYTKRTLNHVSIAFDEDLNEVYSFGRKRPRNPFSGGFVRENIQSSFLKRAECALYAFQLTESEYQHILQMIQKIEAEKDKYRYNFIGLIAFLLNIQIDRKHAFFCSEFVATLLCHTETFELEKPICFTKPEDIQNQSGMHLVYRGTLENYQQQILQRIQPFEEDMYTARERSFIFSLRNKMKQFVIRYKES